MQQNAFVFILNRSHQHCSGMVHHE